VAPPPDDDRLLVDVITRRFADRGVELLGRSLGSDVWALAHQDTLCVVQEAALFSAVFVLVGVLVFGAKG
jgi:hypothetical protein